MISITVLELDDELKLFLKRRAERYARSMEEEVRDILRNAVKPVNEALPGLGLRIAARFSRVGLVGDLPELRGQVARPADRRR